MNKPLDINFVNKQIKKNIAGSVLKIATKYF